MACGARLVRFRRSRIRAASELDIIGHGENGSEFTLLPRRMHVTCHPSVSNRLPMHFAHPAHEVFPPDELDAELAEDGQSVSASPLSLSTSFLPGITRSHQAHQLLTRPCCSLLR